MTKLNKALIAVSLFVTLITACILYSINTIATLTKSSPPNALTSAYSQDINTTSKLRAKRIGDKWIDSKSDVYYVKYEGAFNIANSKNFRVAIDKIARKATSDDLVLIEIDSLGGIVEACETDHHIIKQLKKETGAYVVTMTDNYADSCGYYVLSAGDYIYASVGANVGNVGVVYDISTHPAQLFVEYFGGKIKKIASTDIKSTFAGGDVSDERKSEIITAAMLKAYDRFTGDITAMRGNKITDKELAFSGYPLSAREAKRIGMVDELKDTRSIIRGLNKFGHKVQLIFIPKPQGALSSLSSAAKATADAINNL